MVVSGNAEDRLMVRDIKLKFSIRKGSWFEGSNLEGSTSEEILKLTLLVVSRFSAGNNEV